MTDEIWKLMKKNWASYYCYLFKFNIRDTILVSLSFVVSIIIILLDCYNFVLNKQVSLWLLLIPGSIIIIDILKIYSEIRKSIFESMKLKYGEIVDKKDDFEELEVSDREKKLGYEIINCPINDKKIEHAIVSDKINQYIINNDLEIVDSKNGRKLFANIKKYKTDLFTFLRWQYRLSSFYGKGFYNEKKFCLSEDISLENKLVYCHKATYYDTFLANIMCSKEMHSNRDDHILVSMPEFFSPFTITESNTYKIKDITSSYLSNEIGISTLGLTQDGYLVIWKQNRTAQSSEGLLVPTGSGSCDWYDKKSNDFKATISGAMQRELYEECFDGKRFNNQFNSFIRKWKKQECETIGDTKVIGFFRWVEKGGRPEFVGISKLNVRLKSFKGDDTEVYDREAFPFKTFEELKNQVNAIQKRKNISVSLFMNLYCLEKFYSVDFESFREFCSPLFD